MITIVKDDSKLVVSMQTFEEQYKHLGYHMASNDKEATKKVASIVKEEDIKEEVKETPKKETSAENSEEEKINKKYGFKSTKKGK